MLSRNAAQALRGIRASFNFTAKRNFVSGAQRSAGRSSTGNNFFPFLALGIASTGFLLLNSNPIQNEAVPLGGVKGTDKERTFIAVKPDGVQRALVGEIISRFEKRGYKLVGLKLLVPSQDLAKEHYADLSSKPFFNGLVDYMTNGKAPVVGMVWEGLDVIKQGRAMIGATNPLAAQAGTIRGDHCISVGRNIIHGSDSFESATKEIGLWFGKPGEVVEWSSALGEWIFANN